MTNTKINPSEVISTQHPVYAKRVNVRKNSNSAEIWKILDTVYDPELPGLTLWDLGVLQDVQQVDEMVTVVITPTYSGCPAVDAMREDAIKALNKAGFLKVKVNVVLAPAWSSDMISPAGKQQLKALHIAPPSHDNHVDCPVCHSNDTQVLSEFGSTACKAMYRCNHCKEIFDYFKQL